MNDAVIFDFTKLHSLSQLKKNRAALVTVLENIRSTLTRLFETKLVFHVLGSHASRLMLEAQEQLSAVLDTIDTMGDDASPDQLKALQTVLTRVGALTQDAATRLKSITAAK